MNIEQVLERNFPILTEEYRKFAKSKNDCRACSIYEQYKQVTQAEGCTDRPTFMFVGEASGRDEIAQNRPFIGLAGQRLRTELRKYPDTFKRKNTLISNVLACRPLDNKFPSNDSNPDVMTCTRKWLFAEIKLVRPKIIIALGNPALKWLRGDWGITSNRGQWKFLSQFKAWSFATYHPSYVIRSEKSGKQFVVNDFEIDIKSLSSMWQTMINDPRLSMDDEEWKHELAVDKAIEMGLLK